MITSWLGACNVRIKYKFSSEAHLRPQKGI